MNLPPLPDRTIARNPWLTYVAQIESIRPEIASVKTFGIRFIDSEVANRYQFRPGQFNMLYLPGCGESAISLSGPASSHGSAMIHTIRSVGRVTEAIAKIRVGDQIGVRGPYGTAWPLETCRGRDVIMMSGGIGLAPLRPLIYELLQNRHEFGRIALLYGARSPDLILYCEELEAWRQQGIEVDITVDRAGSGWGGKVGVVPTLWDQLMDLRIDRTEVLVCGPEVMMHYAALSATRSGIPEKSIWLSVERNMQCAVGLCGHCQLGPIFVCRDGPVFRYDTIKTLLRVRDF